MSKPRILVMTAAGKTGLPTALQLLSEGFPVTAFVHKEDQRSECLKSRGADIVMGSLTDINDVRRAMAGVQRAYFCTPGAEGNLKTASVFTAVAAEQQLKSVVAMSQWLSSPNHPSLHTREVWLTDRLLALLPGTDLTILNPGFFADNDMQPLAYAAQFGLLMLPYGSGRNAPPSNEDISRGWRLKFWQDQQDTPERPIVLLAQNFCLRKTPQQIRKVLGRKVKYINAPIWMVRKIMKGIGFSDYLIAQS